MTPEWHRNPPPKIMRVLTFIMFPSISAVMFLFSAFVLPPVFHTETKWWIVAFVTGGPLAMMGWALFVAALQPKRIALDADAMVWETGLGKIVRIPRERILRLEPLQNRKHGIAMCFFLDEKGREKWTGVTVEIEQTIRAWLVKLSS